jgi:hypothetical protein
VVWSEENGFDGFQWFWAKPNQRPKNWKMVCDGLSFKKSFFCGKIDFLFKIGLFVRKIEILDKSRVFKPKPHHGSKPRTKVRFKKKNGL